MSTGGGEETRGQELVIIRRRGGGEEGGHHGGVWKIAYADFMTAMMAFFLVMWLINSTDKKTLTQVATYFNPLRLTDKTPAARGLHQSETGTPQHEHTGGSPSQGKGKGDAKSEAKPDGKGDAGKAETKSDPKSDAKSDAKPEGKKAEGAKARFSEEVLFKDPYAALSKIAVEAEADQRRAEAAARRSDIAAGGEAFRDPFEPAFRRSAQGDAVSEAKSARQSQPQRPPLPQPQTPQEAQQPGGPAVQPGGAAPDSAQRAKEAQPVKDAQEAKASEPAKDAQAKDAQAAKLAEKAAELTAAAQLDRQIRQALAGVLAGSLPGIEVVATEEGVLVSVTDKYDFGMFAIASAEPRPTTVVIMEKLARVLETRPERLIVRGHTDGRPYKSGTYDNWRLSSARAHMAYYMLVRGGIDEKRFERVEGHADRSLKVPNDAEAAQNRRIEILLRKPKS